MLQKPNGKLKSALVSYRECLSHGDINKISRLVGIPQYRVSRILSGDFSRITSSVIKICIYANISIDEYRTRVPFKVYEMIDDLWDGTEEAEEALMNILGGLKKLKMKNE